MEILHSTLKYIHVCLNIEKMFWITWRLGKIKASHVYVVTLSAHSFYPWGFVLPNLRCRITWSPSFLPALDAHDFALRLSRPLN